MQEINECEKSCLSEENQSLKQEISKLKKEYEKLQNSYNALEKTFDTVVFKLLEKELTEAILKHHPVDFNDVWAIVIDRLKKKQYSSKDFDLIIEDVKKYNPTLFYRFSLKN